MISLNFEKSSWHYKVAKFGSLQVFGGETDMCHYVRSFIWGVVKGLVVATIMGGIAALVLACEGAFIGSFIAAIMTGYWIFEGFAIGGAMINTVVSVLGVIAGGWYLWEQYREKHPKQRKPRKPDGFVKNAYNGWKDKYCAKVIINKTPEQLADEAEHAAYCAARKAEREAAEAAELAAQVTESETFHEPQSDVTNPVRDGSGEEAAPGA